MCVLRLPEYRVWNVRALCHTRANTHRRARDRSPSRSLVRSHAACVRECVSVRYMRIFVFIHVFVLLLLGIQYCMLLAGTSDSSSSSTSASTAANVFSVDRFSMSANFYSVGGLSVLRVCHKIYLIYIQLCEQIYIYTEKETNRFSVLVHFLSLWSIQSICVRNVHHNIVCNYRELLQEKLITNCAESRKKTEEIENCRAISSCCYRNRQKFYRKCLLFVHEIETVFGKKLCECVVVERKWMC